MSDDDASKLLAEALPPDRCPCCGGKLDVGAMAYVKALRECSDLAKVGIVAMLASFVHAPVANILGGAIGGAITGALRNASGAEDSGADGIRQIRRELQARRRRGKR